MKLAVRSTGAHPWRRARNLLAVAATVFATPALAAPVAFQVSLGQASATAVSGRLLVFAKPLGPADKRPVAAVNMDQIDTHTTAIAAREVARLEPEMAEDLWPSPLRLIEQRCHRLAPSSAARRARP